MDHNEIEFRHPTWLNRNEYPFEPKFIQVPAGKIHYVDEGKGDIIVFLHGNPSWSFDYRNVIKRMRSGYRCIALDHIGFGLSDKPENWDYKPKSHAENFKMFIGRLGLSKFTLVVNDWGGPIGLSYALAHPERIEHIVIANSWMWAVNGDLHFEVFSKLMGGPIGAFLSHHFNFFAKVVGKQVFGDGKKLKPEIFKHYSAHLGSKQERKGTWIFPKHITASGKWLDDLWNKRQKIYHIPALLLWGMKDIAFREKELNRWIAVFEKTKVVRFEESGHFPQEEVWEPYSKALMEFMTSKAQ